MLSTEPSLGVRSFALLHWPGPVVMNLYFEVSSDGLVLTNMLSAKRNVMVKEWKDGRGWVWRVLFCAKLDGSL